MSTNTSELLSTLVHNEKRVVTYKWLSRHLGIHVNAAKRMLSELKEADKSVHVVYCLFGSLASAQLAAVLVAQEELEAIKQTFVDIMSVHVYSVEAGRLKDSGALIASNRESRSHNTADPSLYGVIQNNHVELASCFSLPTSTTLSETSIRTSYRGANHFPEKALKTGREANITKGAPLTKKSVNVNDAKNGANQDIMSFGRKEDVNKNNNRAARKRKVIREETDSEEDRKESYEVQARQLSTSNHILDGATVDEEADTKSSGVSLEHVMDNGRAAENLPSRENMDIDENDCSRQAQSAHAPNLPDAPKTTQRRRGRRKATKKKTYTDNRGFWVTEDVIEWESFSEEEPTALPKTNSVYRVKSSRSFVDGHDDTIPPKKKKKSPNDVGQKTLLNFFRKA